VVFQAALRYLNIFVVFPSLLRLSKEITLVFKAKLKIFRITLPSTVQCGIIPKSFRWNVKLHTKYLMVRLCSVPNPSRNTNSFLKYQRLVKCQTPQGDEKLKNTKPSVKYLKASENA